MSLGVPLEVSDEGSDVGDAMPNGGGPLLKKEQNTEHIRRGVHYRRSDQDVDSLATAADVLLETDDTVFPAHSSILSLNSSVFCDMLARKSSGKECEGGGSGSGCAGGSSSDVGRALPEKTPPPLEYVIDRNGEKLVVHLKESSKDVRQLLRFLYDRHASKHGLDLAAALKLLSTANKYGVPSLAEMCLGRVLEFWPLHAEGKLLVHESTQEGLGCRHGTLLACGGYRKDDEFDVFTWWRAAQRADDRGGMLNRCKALLAILLASNTLVSMNKCYSDVFLEEYEVDGHVVCEPRSDMSLIMFSGLPKQCEMLESKGVSKEDCLEIGWMVSWLLRSVKSINADDLCAICSVERTPSSDVRICALCATKLRPFWW